MMVEILSPVSGLREVVSELPDPVFAAGLVGPGAAIRPHSGRQTAVAPIDGVLAKVHPHAFVVVSDRGPGVLVHLGMDTVHLNGAGFTALVQEQERVSAGDEVVTWDPAYVEAAGHSSVCAVVVLDCPYAAHALGVPGSEVAAAEPLFEIDC
jgi:PTS system N-acetylglucosamine-specific IIA component